MGAPLITGLDSDAQIEGVVRRGIAYLVNGYDAPSKRFMLNGVVTTQNLGLQPSRKTTDLTLSETGAGVMTGDFAGCICYYNYLQPLLLESNPGPIMTVTGLAAKQVRFTWATAGLDSQITHVRCYLTVAGAAAEYDQMYLVAEVAVATGQVDVNLADAAIAALPTLDVRNDAPAGRYCHICVHKNRIALANRIRSYVCGGTANAGSGIGTLVDTVIQNYEADYLVNMWVVIRPGLATEERRQILTYTPASGTITFTNLTTLVSAGNAYEIYEESNATEVIWSDPDKPEVFPPDNAVSIDGAILDEVTAIASFHDHILAFSRTAAVAINAETAQVHHLPLDFGCVSARSIQRCGFSMLFLSEKGVYQLMPGYGFQNITRDMLDDFTLGVNRAYQHRACACYSGQRYCLAFAGTGESKNNKFFFYDFLVKGWFERVYAFKVMSMCSLHDEDGTERLYAGVAAEDPGWRVKVLDLGVNDLGDIDPAANVGTATSGTTSNITDTTQAWTVDQFVGAPVRVRRQGTEIYEDSVCTANTATALTLSPVLTFTPVAGDSYEIGVFDSEFESADLEFGRPHEEKRLLWAHVEVRNEFDEDSEFTIGAARDAEPGPYKSLQADKDRTFAKASLIGRGKLLRLVLSDCSPDSPGLVKHVVLAAEVDRGQQ